MTVVEKVVTAVFGFLHATRDFKSFLFHVGDKMAVAEKVTKWP